jgi:hypothetical protein
MPQSVCCHQNNQSRSEVSSFWVSFSACGAQFSPNLIFSPHFDYPLASGIIMSVQILWFLSGAGISLVIVFDEMLEARRSPHLIRVNSNQIQQGATTRVDSHPKISQERKPGRHSTLATVERGEKHQPRPLPHPPKGKSTQHTAPFSTIFSGKSQICERGGLHLCPW